MNQDLRSQLAAVVGAEVKRSPRPLEDLVGRRVIYRGTLINTTAPEPGLIRAFFKDIEISAFDPSDLRIVEHVWISFSSDATYNISDIGSGVTGLGKIYKYTRRNRTVDFGIEQLNFYDIEDLFTHVSRTLSDGSLSGMQRFKRCRTLYSDYLEFLERKELLYPIEWDRDQLYKELKYDRDRSDELFKLNEKYHLNSVLRSRRTQKRRPENCITLQPHTTFDALDQVIRSKGTSDLIKRNHG